jgi:hypothetical protein
MTNSTRPQNVPKLRLADRTSALVAVFALLFVTLAGTASAAQFKWRVATDAPYSQVRPAVGPDGSAYAVDVFDNLIAVAPDGTEQWRVANAGSKGVDVADDGTIYTGNESWIKAFNPDGSLKWTFTQDPRAFVLIDIAVGPDGNIYAVASSGMGVFSLADGGPGNPILRWKTPEAYTRIFVGYTEIAFGLSTTPGCIQQLYFYANSHTRAVCLEDGSSIFSVGGGNTRPKVSPVDNTWHRGDSAYSPDGVLQWRAELPLFAGFTEPSLAWDGTHYTVVSGNELYAIDLLGTVQWTAALNEFVGLPDVDPTKSVVIMPTTDMSTSPLALKAVSAENGSPLWRVEFPADDSGLDQAISSGVAFSANGDTAYVMTFVSGVNRTYLNAVDTSVSAGPGLTDTDNDTVLDHLDNCTLIENTDQRDTDNDGYGNACDPDFDNNLIVNASDLAYIKSASFTPDPDADLTGDGIVNAADLAALKIFYFKPPGPSAIAP